MGQLTFFPAGINKSSLPSAQIENILLNVPNSGKHQKAINNTKQFLKEVNANITILDSGGFQLLKGQKEGKMIRHDPHVPLMYSGNVINITPDHVIAIAKELSPTFVVALDFPIRKLADPGERRIEFRTKLAQNLKWARRTAVLHQRLNLSSQLLIPLQFYTSEDLIRFLDGIKILPFAGVCMPLRNQTPKVTAEFLLEIHRRGISKVHLLGSSSFTNIALAAWFAGNCFDWVSFDSATWRILAEKGMGYLDPLDLHCHKLKEHPIRAFPSECHCPICKRFTFNEILNTLSSDHTRGVKLIRAHNFFVTGSVAQSLFDHTRSHWSLVKYLESLPTRKGFRQLIETVEWLDDQMVSKQYSASMLKAA